ncbi:MAG: HDOD domain-containing protein [Gammaproteobacteria bacterium]|nr:HDOD domain-containing protein [Gammaproteobacteria bacterium]
MTTTDSSPSADKMESMLNGIKIPPQPKVLSELREQAGKGFPNMQLVAQIISRDVSLSASVIKIINSPFYGLNQRVSSIQQAVMLLGADKLMGLATAAALRQTIKGKGSISIEKFWERAADIANLCMGLARSCHYSKLDEFYALGLFHDSGVAMLAQHFPNYKEIQAEANTTRESITDVEDKHYQTDHATIGYFLSKSWYLPDAVAHTIRDHHDLDHLLLPGAENDERNGMMCILRMATNIHYSANRVSSEPDWDIIGSQILGYMQIQEEEYEDMILDMTDKLAASR